MYALSNQSTHCVEKRIATLQQQMSFAIEAQTRLETDYYAREQDLEELKKTVAQLTREKKEVVKQLKSEVG